MDNSTSVVSTQVRGEELGRHHIPTDNVSCLHRSPTLRHVHEWSQITDDYISLQAIRGVKLPLIGRPPVRCPSNTELDERRVDPVIDEAIKVVPSQV